MLAYKIIIPYFYNTRSYLVTYNCKIWFLTMGEEHKLQVFVNTLLRQIFVPKKDDFKW